MFWLQNVATSKESAPDWKKQQQKKTKINLHPYLIDDEVLLVFW